MQIPMEVTFRNVRRTPEIERLIQKKVQSLEKRCHNIISCHVAVEKPREHPHNGNPHRVRIDLRVPHGHELVAKSKPGDNPMHEGVHAVITETFHTAERQLDKLLGKMRGDVKKHPNGKIQAVVEQLFKDAGYGFLLALDGTEYYFHQNSVLHNDFDRLTQGTGVRFVGETGDNGPQASTVEIVDKPDAGSGL